MPRGRPRSYAGPLRKGEKTAAVPGLRLNAVQRVAVSGLNKTEKKQVRDLAKQQIRLRSETKQRAWLYPKTTYSELLHNKPFFLFGDDNRNGLLNLAKGDDSVVHPNGGKLPIDEPGNCREGQAVRLHALTHNCILSGDNANKNTMVRMIMFSYPSGVSNTIGESDILLQPFGTGAGEGWPNIFLSKNKYNKKGVKFILDRTYQLNGVTSGAIVEAEDTAVNWGLSGVRTFQFNKVFKNGKKIKYVENDDGTDGQIPAVENYGIMIIPYGSGVTEQDEKCGRIEILGNMLFKDL